jgi:hypothetical protein
MMQTPVEVMLLETQKWLVLNETAPERAMVPKVQVAPVLQVIATSLRAAVQQVRSPKYSYDAVLR